MYRSIVIEEKFDLTVNDKKNTVLRSESYTANFVENTILVRYLFHNETLIKKDSFKVLEMNPGYLKIRGKDKKVRALSYTDLISKKMKVGDLNCKTMWRIYEDD